ncbi:MAG TPA: long-chain fatty acid--CoA ligase [Chloroflexi bacterium]|nr:long-chain fatty acid--CoA ligase [Chloroflexota bacterium]
MSRQVEDIITAERAGTLSGLFHERVRRSRDEVAYVGHDRGLKQWVESTWGEMLARVAHWQAGLGQENLEKGDRVAIMHRNSKEWVVFEQAALGLELVVVPLYTDDRPENVAYIIDDAAISLLLVSDRGMWRRLKPAVEKCASLKRVLVLEGDAEEDQRVRNVPEWLPEEDEEEPFRPVRSGADPKSLATIVYTSGTTGRPKGVMLSHWNILSIAHSALISYEVFTSDMLLSFLPLSHTFERTVGYYLPMMAGASVSYARSVQQLADDLVQVRPTTLIAVPRIFERIHTRIQQQLAKKGVVARFLFNLTVRVGWRRFLARQGEAMRGPSLLLWPVLDRLVARGIRDKLGGRARLVVSGGAALPLQVSKVFLGLGIPILQGYGMTETSPVVSGNPVERNKPASVGLPLKHVEVKIGENDELLVRGPGVMLGYWNNHAATAAMIDADGWLHTGDQARIDEDGYIYITGRIKDILVLSNGEKVPPADAEAAIMIDPLFEQVLVLGEGKPFLSAIAVLNSEEWFALAQELGLDPTDGSNLRSEKVERRLVNRMRELMSDFPGYAKIRRVHATLEPWTVDNGLLTPTLKVKRAKVLERYQKEVAAIYEER